MKNQLELLSYPDFVAFLGQKNTPPGGSYSVQRTIELAKIDSNSFVLDLACSTGFSSREAVKKTRCRSVGVDLSHSAIEHAKYEAKQSGLESLLQYEVCPAEDLTFDDNEFSHILSGCNFSFIQEREKALNESYRVLVPDGKLCVANFFYSSRPTEDILDQVEMAIGFRPMSFWSREWWLEFFSSKFELQHEEIHNLPYQNPSELESSVRLLVEKNPLLENLSEHEKSICSERLYKIRSILNEHRKSQKFNITIWAPSGK